jgi:high-affinity Fe2+/Pb2+ permease
MTEAYIFLSSFIILGGTFLVDYLSNRNSINKNKYGLGVLYLLVSTGLIIQLTYYLHTNSNTILKISFRDKAVIVNFKL